MEEREKFFEFMYSSREFTGINTEGTYIEDFYSRYEEYKAEGL